MTAVLQVVPLGMQWPTIDPFLFCVHHLDAYPAGNDRQGPVADLTDRPLGQDFEGIEGWPVGVGARGRRIAAATLDPFCARCRRVAMPER